MLQSVLDYLDVHSFLTTLPLSFPLDVSRISPAPQSRQDRHHAPNSHSQLSFFFAPEAHAAQREVAVGARFALRKREDKS